MFTGLIEEVGRVRRVQKVRTGLQRLEIDAATVTGDLAVGDSVNINGACQTAVEVTGAGFTVESVEETLRRTTLGSLSAGDPVNLERALSASARLGGHMVLGHVDGVGTIDRFEQGNGQWTLEVEPPEPLRRYIAGKGSIAIDGISLTVAEVLENEVFTVAIIPHTFDHTNLSVRRAGDGVNLEVDVVARYVERLLGGEPAATSRGLQMDDLRRMGYEERSR